MTSRIAVHRDAGPDALTAVWLAERYLYAGPPAEVEFYPRGAPLHQRDGVWRAEPGACRGLIEFGVGLPRKPRFAERYAASATGHLWASLQGEGRPVAHLVDLVDAVHAATLAPGGVPADAPKAALWADLFGAWAGARKKTADDLARYHAVRRWLDYYEVGLGTGRVVRVDWDRVGRLRGAQSFQVVRDECGAADRG